MTSPTTADPFTAPGPLVKRYRWCGCGGNHPTYRSWAVCAWPSAAWITGDGRYAVVARCRRGALTVTLHAALTAAQAAFDRVGRTGCGGVCCGRHDLIQIVHP
ncbi:hypothetical protein P9209_20865 [Prescottella defluvii]|nr:hypothetical protein P9209_20865 [Prescottella defluvii]